jgi:hypothetical protein
MSRIGATTCVFVVALATAQSAFAQPNGRVSVVGTVEYAHIPEDEGFLGAGIGAAGGLQFHLTESTSVAVEVGRQRHVRDLEFFAVAFDSAGHPQPLPYIERWEGTATFVLGLVSRTFGSGRARPAVWGGAGHMSHGGTTRGPLTQPQVPPGFTLQSGDAETRTGGSSKAFLADGGFGVDVNATDRVTVRPFVGFRLVNTGGFGPKYIIRSGARVAVRW